VIERVRLHPLEPIVPFEQVTVGVPHASVAEGAVTFPHSGTVGLHPKSVPAVQLVNEGAVVSSVHVQVRWQVEELEHPSVAVQVMVREREQPLEVIVPFEHVTVGVLQPSVAVGAVTLLQAGTVGLHPKSVPGLQLVNEGASVSSVHVQVLVQVAELLHASVAVQVMERERLQPVDEIVPLEQVTVGLPQLSVAVGAVTLLQAGIVEGLHPKLLPAAQVPNTGATLSETVIVVQHTNCPSSQVIVSQSVNEPQVGP
jgi:hypothetical protein